MFKIYDGREHFWQWDLNQKLIVEDPTINEVHFSNRADEDSLPVEVYEENGLRLANVPNIFLQEDLKIKAYAYSVDHTKHEAWFYVTTKSKPADYVYTETEVKSWEALEQRVIDATSPEAILAAVGDNVITPGNIVEFDIEVEHNETDIYNANAVNGVLNEVVYLVEETYEAVGGLDTKLQELEEDVKQNYANAVHGSASGEIVYANDVSTTNPQLEVKKYNEDNHVTEIIATSRNLATIVGRERRELFGTSQNTSTRPFYGNNIVLNISGSNYYTGYNKIYDIPDWITYDKETETFTLPYNENRNSWYGVGIDVRIKPKTTYYLCGETLTDNSVLVFAQYDKNGNYLTFASLTGTTGKITTVADAAWGLLVFASKTKATEAKFRNVIFKESATVPEFEPATEVVVTISTNGVIPRVAEDMCIYSKDFDTTVEVNYTKDLNAVINTLTQAIISLGGNI